MNEDIKKKLKNSTNPVIKIVWYILHITKRMIRLVTDRSFRAQWTMVKFKKNRVQQTTQLTWENRYPDIFGVCRNYFYEKRDENIKILSYGCCTGEEVITLRQYFPNAVIVGAELNKHSLRVCRKRKCDSNIRFIYSKPELIRKYGPYDAVFCMAVLERLPMEVQRKHITDIGNMYPFEKYDKQIHEIDSYVKNGGLLVAHFTHYDIMDTDLADYYCAYGVNGFRGMVFGTDSKLKKDNEFQQSIFVKNI